MRHKMKKKKQWDGDKGMGSKTKKNVGWRQRGLEGPHTPTRYLLAMAPLQDPALQEDIRTHPINGTRNKAK
jgi:hypothetical protein